MHAHATRINKTNTKTNNISKQQQQSSIQKYEIHRKHQKQNKQQNKQQNK